MLWMKHCNDECNGVICMNIRKTLITQLPKNSYAEVTTVAMAKYDINICNNKKEFQHEATPGSFSSHAEILF